MSNFESPHYKSDQEIAEEFEKSGELEKAAKAYEKGHLYDKSAEMWRELGKLEKATGVYTRAAEGIESRPKPIDFASIGEDFATSDLLKFAAELREKADDLENATKDYREAARYMKEAKIRMDPARWFVPANYETPHEYKYLLNKAREVEEKIKILKSKQT